MQCHHIITKLKLVTVEPVLFLYMMVIFLETNALQELIYVKSCITLLHPTNLSDCSYEFKQNQSDAQNLATNWSKYNSVCLFFFTFISTFYVGSWSDQFGRKVPMLIAPIGTAIASLVNATLSYYINAHTAYFFISSFISGITFGTVGIIATTYGFVSDFTHEQSRTKRIVILEAMIFIGGTVGIYIGGLFLKHVNFELTLNNFVQLFLFECLVATFLVIYICLRIPRCTNDTQSLQSTSTLSGLFGLKHIIDSLRTVFRYREDGKRKKVMLMLLALVFVYLGNVVQLTLGYYFAKDVLHWEFNKYTNFLTMVFGVKGAALLIGLPVIFYFLQPSDYLIGGIGVISRITGFTMFGLSTNDNMLYSCVGLYVFSEFPVPALRSMLSKTVSADEKGRIFAFTTILQNVCYLLGSFILMTIFTEFSFRGLSFEVVAAMQGFSLLIFGYLFFTRKAYVTMYETIENEDGSVTEICSVVEASDPSD